MVFINDFIEKAPGSVRTKVFVGTALTLGLLAFQFYGGEKKKAGD